MSKASEWAAIVKTAMKVSDPGAHIIGRDFMMRADPSNTLAIGYRHDGLETFAYLKPEDACVIARWILDTFEDQKGAEL